MHSGSCAWAAVLFLIILIPLRFTPEMSAQDFDWRRDWAVAPGFSMEPHTEGYHFPTAIAFVPEPGSAPDDALYFVTELRGTVKVVTNDRSVHVFAQDFFHFELAEELPSFRAEAGMAGICLAPDQGYVFVTFIYQDSEGVLRNGIARFSTNPRTFSTAPSSYVEFTDIFKGDVSAISHQIGACQVQNDLLWVSVGEGERPPESQKLTTLLGKVLRMTLDGEPAPGNPFADEEPNHPDPADYMRRRRTIPSGSKMRQPRED